MDNAIIELTGVSFSYQQHTVLEDVDLRVGRGDFLAVIGPNGSGKTTLLKIILGLLRPHAGSVRVLGEVPERVSGRIGYVPQQILFKPDFPITVMNVVLMGLINSRRRGWSYTARDRQQACRALEQVEMIAYRDRPVSRLSGGELQRVVIARSLVADPALLLLDEPTSNIDPHGKFCFFEFLAELSCRITIVVVSHDIHIISSRVNSVACVNRRLFYSPRPELTPEMLTLMYGEHSDSCSAGAAIRQVSARLGQQEREGG